MHYVVGVDGCLFGVDEPVIEYRKPFYKNHFDHMLLCDVLLSPVKTRGYRVELVRLSVCPSVRLSVPLDIGYFVHASLG